MEKKAKIFRYIVANVVLIGALLATIIYVVPLVGVVAVADEPYFRAESQTEVAVMFKVDRNHNSGLDTILEVLHTHNKSATFFVSGSFVLENSNSILRLVEYGHELANAGFFETQSDTKLTATKVREEIELNHKLVYALTGASMNLFTPPNNNFLPIALDITRALGYTTIAGSNVPVVTTDTSAQILSKIITNLQAGDFILLPATQTVASALDKLLLHITELGLQSVAARELI